MADGRVLDSTALLPDFMLFEKTAKKHGWKAAPSENPVLWEAFLAWASLRRTGQYEGTWEAFIDGEAVLVDAKVPESVDPIQPAVGTG
jgi:hypothetical protein